MVHILLHIGEPHHHQICTTLISFLIIKQIGCALIEFATSFPAFYACTAAVHHAANDASAAKTNNRLSEALATMPAARVTWLCALFLCCYVGIEVAIGGWVVTFMLRVRHGANFASGMTETGFWLGITVGRVVLGFVTGRIGERLAISVSYTLGLEDSIHAMMITKTPKPPRSILD